jgi:hypothetical protein
MNMRCSGGSSRIFSRALKAGGGEHVHLVDDIDPLFDVGGGVHGLVPQGADLVYAVVGGGVQLHHVQKAAASMPRQEGHSPQGLPFTGCSQLTALARILAQVVLPVPRVPVKR